MCKKLTYKNLVHFVILFVFLYCFVGAAIYRDNFMANSDKTFPICGTIETAY